jgi:hypothetical protein
MAVAAADLGGGGAAMRSRQGGKVSNSSLSSVKALVFDTFGTVVDWRSSIAKEIEALARARASRWTVRSSPMHGGAVTVRA